MFLYSILSSVSVSFEQSQFLVFNLSIALIITSGYSVKFHILFSATLTHN